MLREGEPMDKESIAETIFQTARNYAFARGFYFGDVEGDIKGYASDAASEIAAQPTDQQQSRVNAASLSFERLIDEMIAQSPPTTGDQLYTSRIAALDGARKKLCPLWPIC
jgi:hypothetical protein